VSAPSARRRELLEVARRDAMALRDEWRDALAHHQMRVEAKFRELTGRLKPGKARAKGLPSAHEAKALHQALGQARMKPGKGRAKDLRRVERLLDEALALLPPQE